MKLILLWLFIFPYSLMASSDLLQKRWWGVHSVVDLHKYYKLNEPIISPADSVQSLMGLIYYSESFKIYKDCIGYEIPRVGDIGKVFIITSSVENSCDSVIMNEKRDIAFKVRSLSFDLKEEELILLYTDEMYRSKEIHFSFPHLGEKRNINFYHRSIIVLAPDITPVKQPHLWGKINDSWSSQKFKSCQKVDDDCNQSESTCEKCRYGYFEIKNGCASGGPKFCGIDQCGKKGFPACSRGQLYQTGELKNMDCRLDHSFVFCNKGLSVRCQGSLAICD